MSLRIRNALWGIWNKPQMPRRPESHPVSGSLSPFWPREVIFMAEGVGPTDQREASPDYPIWLFCPCRFASFRRSAFLVAVIIIIFFFFTFVSCHQRRRRRYCCCFFNLFIGVVVVVVAVFVFLSCRWRRSC